MERRKLKPSLVNATLKCGRSLIREWRYTFENPTLICNVFKNK